jgi:hypothetical protein
MVDNGDGTITLVPAPGTVTEAGTPVNAVNMNKLEQGVENAQDAAETAQVTADAALPKAGGTLAGNLIVSANNPSIQLSDNNSANGMYLGADDNAPFFGTSTNSDLRLIVNSSEFGRLKTNGDMLIGANKVWHAGNDGFGSGLQADTVPGYGIGVHISSSISDFDSTVLSGNYYANSVAANAPAAGYDWSLIVVSFSSSYVTQIATAWNTGVTYTRVKFSGTWGGWRPVGNSIMVASNTVRESQATQYDATTDVTARFTLVYKFIPKGTGEIVVDAELQSTVATGRLFLVSASATRKYLLTGTDGQAGAPYSFVQVNQAIMDYRTPLGTVVLGAGASGSGGTVGPNTYPVAFVTSSTWTTVEFAVQVTEAVPVYLGLTTSSAGATSSVRNIQIKYDIMG